MDSFGCDNNNYKPWIGFHDTSNKIVFRMMVHQQHIQMGHQNYQWNDIKCDSTLPSFMCNRHKSVQQYNNYIGINTHGDNKKYN